MLIINAAPPPSSDLIPGTIFQFVGLTVNAGSVANVTNGSGLTSATPALTGVHETYSNTNGVRSANIITSPVSLLFTFPAVFWVTGISFWQVTGSTNNNNGIRSVLIQSSLDNSSWISIPNGTLEFPFGGSTPSNPIVISWTPVQARFIKFLVNSVWGSTRIALLEVQFAGYL